MRFRDWLNEDTTQTIGSTNGAFKSDHWSHGWEPDNALVLNCVRFLQGPGKGSEAIYAFSEPMREAIVVAAFDMAAQGMQPEAMVDEFGKPTPMMKQRMQAALGGMKGVDFLLEKYRLAIIHAWEKKTGMHYFAKQVYD